MLFVEFKAAVKPSLRFFAVCKTYAVPAGFKELKFMRYTVFSKRVAQHYAVIVSSSHAQTNVGGKLPFASFSTLEALISVLPGNNPRKFLRDTL